MNPPRGLAVAIAALALATSTPGSTQLPQLSETIEVRVVNVDVVVTTDDGTPIAGLDPADFELRVNGKPVEIDYFSAIRDGSLLRPGGDLRAAAEIEDLGSDEGLEYKPYLAILFDGRSLDTVSAPELFGELGLNLERLAASTRGVMFVRHGRNLSLGRTFSRRPEVLEREMSQLSEQRVRALDDNGQDILLRRLERAQVAAFNRDADDPSADLTVEADAISFLSEIRSLSQIEMAQTTNALRDLTEFVRSMAGLPGRKSVLYLGPGFNVRPGEVLFRLWWAKYAAIAREVGVDSIDAEIGKYRIEEAMVRLIGEASENGVTFYAYDPAGLRPLGIDATLGTMLAVDLATSQLTWSRQALLSLSSGTGGIGLAETNQLQDLVDRMVGDFRTTLPTAAGSGSA